MPKNSLDSKGKLVWEGNKIFPKVLKEDFENNIDQSRFLYFTTKIYCFIFKIPFGLDFEMWSNKLKEYSKEVKFILM